MWRLICVLSLACIAGVKSFSSLPKECTYGPSYWCGSVMTAKQCGAVKHCIQAVWEKQIITKDTDPICNFCESNVESTRQLLEDPNFEKKVTQGLTQLCTVLPIKEIQKECLKIAQEYVPEYIEMLASQMNPDVVCSTIGLCNSVAIDKILAKHPKIQLPGIPKQHTNNVCKECQAAVAEIQMFVRSMGKSEFQEELLVLCGMTGSYSDSCRAIVNLAFEDIYQIVTTADPQVFCMDFNLCSVSQSSVQMSNDPTSCDLCDGFLQMTRRLAHNMDRPTVMKLLHGKCAAAPKGLAGECKALVDQHADAIWNFLHEKGSAIGTCKHLGFCGRTMLQDVAVWTVFKPKTNHKIRQTPLQKPLSINSLIGRDEANSYKIEHKSMGETGIVKKDSTKCVMCEFVMHYLQNMLQDRTTRKEIEQALDKVCTMLPKSLSEQCEDYVDAYGDEVIQLIILEIDPNSICPMLHFCPSKLIGSGVSEPKVPCVMCEFAMTQLEHMLEDRKTESTIRHALDRLCTLMPESVEADCRNFVDQYTEQIIQMLIEDFTPDQVCQKLGLCKAAVPELTAENAQLPVDRMFIPTITSNTEMLEFHQHTGCAVCEFIISELDKILVFPAVEKDIVEAITKVCFVLPKTLMRDCTSIISTYGDEIITLLESELEPESVCTEIHLCKSPQGYDVFKPQTVSIFKYSTGL